MSTFKLRLDFNYSEEAFRGGLVSGMVVRSSNPSEMVYRDDFTEWERVEAESFASAVVEAGKIFSRYVSRTCYVGSVHRVIGAVLLDQGESRRYHSWEVVKS